MSLGPTPTDPVTDEAALAAGHLLFAQECRFLTAATSLSSLPPAGLTEVAFAGRSNVGKSSLINGLTGRKSLARSSNTPGRTRQINFFSLADRVLLVDLPGYGYARASKTEIAAWTALVEDYLRGRPTLRRICLLIDARHGFKSSDRTVMDMLETAAVVYQVVLTKCDKLRPGALKARCAEIQDQIVKNAAAYPEVVATSVRNGDGIAQLRASLAPLAEPEPIR